MKTINLKLSMLLALGWMSSVGYAQTPCTDASKECVISAGTAYLNALVSHDPSGVPLASDAQRWENGVNTGNSGQVIKDGLKNDYRFKVIEAIRDVRWIVDGSQAIAYYLLDSFIPNTEVHASTTHIAERFLVEQGQIKEIEAIFCNSLGTKPENSQITSSNPPSILCNRSLI